MALEDAGSPPASYFSVGYDAMARAGIKAAMSLTRNRVQGFTFYDTSNWMRQKWISCDDNYLNYIWARAKASE